MEKGKFNDQFKIYAGNTHHPQHTRNTANNLLGNCLICLSEKIACDFQIYKHLSPLINFYLNATTKWTYSSCLWLKCSYYTFVRVFRPGKQRLLLVKCKYWSFVHTQACKWIWYRKSEYDFVIWGLSLESFFSI